MENFIYVWRILIANKNVPEKYTITLFMCFPSHRKKNLQFFKRYALCFILLGFGPTEVSLTKLRAHSKTALPNQEDYNA